MARPVTLFTGQWADLPIEELCRKARDFGYDGLELACWGDHFEVDKALAEDAYCARKRELLEKYDLKLFSISNHLAGQAVLDRIDERHKAILPEYVWGDGDPEGVNQRAAECPLLVGAGVRMRQVRPITRHCGVSHAQRPQDPLPYLSRPAPAGDLLDDHTEQDVVGVRVVPPAAGRERGLIVQRERNKFCRRETLEAVLLEPLQGGVHLQQGGVVLQAAGVLEQLPDGDRCAVVAVALNSAGKPLLDRVRQRQPALIYQL
jgi:hypothetical protein